MFFPSEAVVVPNVQQRDANLHIFNADRWSLYVFDSNNLFITC